MTTPTKRPRLDHRGRAELASVDCFSIQKYARDAEDALWAGNMSVALDHLANVEKALSRAKRMIRTGK